MGHGDKNTKPLVLLGMTRKSIREIERKYSAQYLVRQKCFSIKRKKGIPSRQKIQPSQRQNGHEVQGKQLEALIHKVLDTDSLKSTVISEKNSAKWKNL